jgi:hypothetical protein
MGSRMSSARPFNQRRLPWQGRCQISSHLAIETAEKTVFELGGRLT